MAQQPPLLRDVIDIKESISTSDFVLQLSEATTPEGAERALRDYVVTERLLENFDEALGLIRSALDGHTSKAAYLHGSFGSGKSHFICPSAFLCCPSQPACCEPPASPKSRTLSPSSSKVRAHHSSSGSPRFHALNRFDHGVGEYLDPMGAAIALIVADCGW